MISTDKIINFFAPHDCLGCGQEGLILCQLCSFDSFDDLPDRCYRCLALSKDSRVCQKCRPNSRLAHVWVGSEYSGVAKRLIHDFKFERARAAASPIAVRIDDVLPFLGQDVLITYLPTATSRQRLRGYDQSKLIANRLARQRGLRFDSLLGRFGQTRQVGSVRSKRLSQAQEMFYVLKASKVVGRDILIIDDILTTGASLEAAAKLLKAAGARKILAAVFAQKH